MIHDPTPQNVFISSHIPPTLQNSRNEFITELKTRISSITHNLIPPDFSDRWAKLNVNLFLF